MAMASRIPKSGPLSQHWLPLYEAVKRGWTRDAALIAAVKGQSTLLRMLEGGVTFLEDRIFDAAAINLRRRTFKRARVAVGEGADEVSSADGLTGDLDGEIARLIEAAEFGYD
jgi:hypothetical protein